MVRSTNNRHSWSLLSGSAHEVAPRLLGSILERTVDGKIVQVRIVETEAYDQSDAASHSYKGRTARTEIMFGEPGYLYVYFTYGMHYCCNIVVSKPGYGAAVLLRAAEPIEGTDTISGFRVGKSGVELTNGPAKLCQALAIDKSLNGHDLRRGPLKLILQPPLRHNQITQTTRVGISHAKDVPWRFYINGNPYVSKP
ncbi:MAG TPA: DNA-3-methyladenine glycosylase [Candidatus Saccharimonadales bacterium]|nr:DNA-3-methyladenine glycosylase [Candidatus Saccharimonadales bacterium]